MTPTQKTLVQESFAKVLPIADLAAELFYGRLFELEPSVRPLFRGSLREQGRKLMTMLHVAVAGLDHPEQLLPAVADMGRRHVAYGVKESHYDVVGEALLWTLEQGLGEAFTGETREAWAAVYEVLAETMKDAAAERAA